VLARLGQFEEWFGQAEFAHRHHVSLNGRHWAQWILASREKLEVAVVVLVRLRVLEPELISVSVLASPG
jgi:hypothetical protein